MVVDAVVLDKKGAPVTGLKAGDFVLKEDGVAQKLASVEEHKGDEHRADCESVGCGGGRDDQREQ